MNRRSFVAAITATTMICVTRLYGLGAGVPAAIPNYAQGGIVENPWLADGFTEGPWHHFYFCDGYFVCGEDLAPRRGTGPGYYRVTGVTQTTLRLAP